jgi:hypothetical protein
MTRIFTVDVTTSLIAGLLIFFSLLFPNVARGQQPIFTQGLEPFGFQTKPPSKGADGRDLSSVSFLSDDLVLVAINKHKRPISYPLHATSQPATLLLFSLGENKLIRQEQKQMALFDGPIQATQDAHFLLPDGTGLRLCSAEFQCSEAAPLPGPVFVSPRGTRAVVGGIKDLTGYRGNTPVYTDNGQELVDTATLSVLQVFTPDDPFVLPGDNGLLLLKGTKVSGVPPGAKERELDIEEVYDPREVRPSVRFLNDHDVVGFKGDRVGLLGGLR